MTSNDSSVQREVQAIIRPNALLDKMKAGGLGTVYTMSVAHGIEIIGMAKYAGCIAVGLNLEHERTSLSEAVDVCCASLAFGWVDR
jgi:hypothetical protein